MFVTKLSGITQVNIYPFIGPMKIKTIIYIPEFCVGKILDQGELL